MKKIFMNCSRTRRASLFVILGLALLAVSCKKSNSGSNTPSNSSYVSSVRSHTTKAQLVDSFTYDNTHRLTVFAQYMYDTTSGSPVFGSLVATFSYSGTSQQPASYTFIQDGNGANSDLHKLYYDGQNRVVKDTSVSGSGYVNYFSYPGGNLVSRLLFDGTAGNNQIDTVFLSNGNMSSQHVYYPNNAGTADSLSGAPQYGYSSSLNPLYHTEIAGSMGLLLNLLAIDGYGGLSDFISPNVVNKESNLGNGAPAGFTVNFNLSSDSQGRVNAMSFSSLLGSANILFRYY